MILGVDPGTAITGYGLIRVCRDRHELVTYGTLTTPAGMPLATRLQRLHDGLSDLLRRQSPDEAAVEQLFFSRNTRTALAVGHARGVALLALAQAGVEVYEYTPGQVKQSVSGYGRGDKEQVAEMVRILLGLPLTPTPDDAADALALAICHANTAQTRRALLANAPQEMGR